MHAIPDSISNRINALRLAIVYRAAHRGELVLHDRAGGLFSLYCQVLGCLLVSNLLRCAVRLRFVSGDYRTATTGESGWWEQFFETSLYFPERKRREAVIELPATKKSVRFAHLGVALDRQLAHQLTSQIRLRRELLEEAADFQGNHFINRPLVGIHYRGTDKLICEAERIPYAEALDVLAGLDSRIHFFVATDEQAFLDAMLDRFGRRVIFREQHRSTDGTPIHHFEPDHASLGYIRGKDAILDAILLARCHALIRTVSNLSLASTFMNPNIPELIFPTTAAKNGQVKSIRSIEQAALQSQ